MNFIVAGLVNELKELRRSLNDYELSSHTHFQCPNKQQALEVLVASGAF